MAIFFLQWWQGKCLRRKCFDCHAIRLLVNSIFWPLESRKDLIQLKISERLVSSQLLGSNIILFKGKTMSISFHQRRNVEISNHTLEKRWGERCRVGMGESLLCLSALLRQFVPQLLIFSLPPQSQDLLFAENWIKGKRFMARTFAASYGLLCVMPLGSLTYKIIYEKP